MAGNHSDCCFMVIFENVLEYVFFRSENFSFCLILKGPFTVLILKSAVYKTYRTFYLLITTKLYR